MNPDTRPIDSSLQKWLHEQLFESVPCNIAIIDRDFNIVLHNGRFEKLFGSGVGNPCYRIYKKIDQPCEHCAASRTFQDAKVRVNEEVGFDLDGNIAHYLVHIVPVVLQDGTIPYVIELSTDITEIKRLQREFQTLFEKVPCYVAVLNRDYRIVRTNERMREVFGASPGAHCWEVLKHRSEKCDDCPAEASFSYGETRSAQHVGVDKNGAETHYMVTVAPLSSDDPVNNVIEMAIDVTDLHRVENEKLEAERLAAVGQTVAGLAHGIKNILAGLEGGIYFFETGLAKNDQERINDGWDTLNRNVGLISSLAKNLLSFSKGRVPKVTLVEPAKLVEEVVKLYRESTARQGVVLRSEVARGIAPAPFDTEGMLHSCLANLVSNAIDATLVTKKKGSEVVVRCREEGGDTIVFEVQDNGSGMDYDMKQQVFTNFFTTKGDGGTGLGLLLTRKIVQEHGGKIHFESTPGEGSLFRMHFPRNRLPKMVEQESAGSRYGV